MDFGWALRGIQSGECVTRSAWSGNNRYVGLTGANPVPNPLEVVPTVPYLYTRTETGEMVPWTPTHGDILAQDWTTRT